MYTFYLVYENIIASLIELRNLISDVPFFINEWLSKKYLLSLTQTLGWSLFIHSLLIFGVNEWFLELWLQFFKVKKLFSSFMVAFDTLLRFGHLEVKRGWFDTQLWNGIHYSFFYILGIFVRDHGKQQINQWHVRSFEYRLGYFDMLRAVVAVFDRNNEWP